MGYKLRPDLHYCQVASSYIFLDLANDRYFRLPPALEDKFSRLVEDPLSAGAAAPPLLEAGILCASTFRQSLSRPQLVRAMLGADSLGSIKPTALEVMKALSSDIWTSRLLRFGRMAALIRSYSRSKIGRTLALRPGDREPHRVVSAYERAGLFRSPANRCLSRSLAMARRLAHLDCDAFLVIGVRADPFAAHSWVQSSGVVLNDTPDEVARYTPIFFA